MSGRVWLSGDGVSRGDRFIHGHHLRPISEIAEEYEVDPVQDLRPICPNCHAMIHWISRSYSIEEMKNIIEGQP